MVDKKENFVLKLLLCMLLKMKFLVWKDYSCYIYV